MEKTRLEERKEALKDLLDLGAIYSVNELNFYHGRSNHGETWQVMPDFDNSGNKTGKNNVAQIPGLYTANSEIAKQFAKFSKDHEGGKEEVQKIVSINNDNYVFNMLLNPKELNDEDKLKYDKALKILSNFSYKKFTPITFEYRDANDKVLEAIRAYQGVNNIKKGFTYENFDDLYKFIEVNKEILKCFKGNKVEIKKYVKDIVSAYNTYHLLQLSPAAILKSYLGGQKEVKDKDGFEHYESIAFDGKNKFLINPNFISAWCANNSIVGIKTKVDSAKLDGTIIDACHLFDMKKIMTEKQRGEMLQQRINKYGEFTSLFKDVFSPEMSQFLINAQSDEIMNFLYEDITCKNLYEKSGFIKEGWNIGEHTMAVVYFFDKYKNIDFPDELVPFMKAVLLAHDIGKGFAREYGFRQEDCNKRLAFNVYRKLGMNKKYQDLATFILGNSQIFTSRIAVPGRDKSQQKLQEKALEDCCEKVLQFTFKDKKITKNEVQCLKDLCFELQRCDSGAYTRYAVINETKDNRYVTGMNDNFTRSFVKDKYGNPQLKEVIELKKFEENQVIQLEEK